MIGRRRFTHGLGGFVALAAGAIVVVGGVAIAGEVFVGPEEHVEKYIAALEDGDAERVLDLIEGAYRPDESALLTQDVMDSVDDRAVDFKIDQGYANGDEANVRITYRLDGIEQFASIELRRSASFIKAFGEWKIVDPGLSTVSVRAEGATGVDFNGELVDIEDLILDRELRVFPGTYEVTPQSGSSFLAYETQSVSLGSFSETLAFEVAPTEELLPEVTRQADAYLARCIAQRDIAPLSCPNQAYKNDVDSVFADVRWTLGRSPSYTIDSGDGGLWEFSSTTGAADVTARRSSVRSGAPADDVDDTISFSLRGNVLIRGDVATVRVVRAD